MAHALLFDGFCFSKIGTFLIDPLKGAAPLCGGLRYYTLTYSSAKFELALVMHKISNDLLPLFMRDMMTETFASYNMRITSKVKKDHDGILRCAKTS